MRSQQPGGAFTVATLPSATQMIGEAVGTLAYTTDGGLQSWTGTAWTSIVQPNSFYNTVAPAVSSALRNIGGASQSLSGAPFSQNDPSVILDIGIASLSPRNTWLDLPTGFSYTAGVNSSIDNTNGFMPGGQVTVTFTTAPSGTSATLSSNWAYTTAPAGGWATLFSDGQIRFVTYTNGATTATWTGALTGSPTATASAIVPNSNGRVANAAFNSTDGINGTIYFRVQRQAVSIDGSLNNTSTLFYDGAGNIAAAAGGNYPPALMTLNNGASNQQLLMQLTVGNFQTVFNRSSNNVVDRIPKINQTSTGFISFQPQILSSGATTGAFDTSDIEIVVTWAPQTLNIAFTAAIASTATSATLQVAWAYTTGTYYVTFSDGEIRGVTLTNAATTATWTGGLTNSVGSFGQIPMTRYWYYLDSILLSTSLLGSNTDTQSGQLQPGMFYSVGIGNGHAGPNAYFGGALGPYYIRRVQLSKATYYPPVGDCLIGFTGDSFTVGGGTNGGAILPNTATAGQIAADTQGALDPANPSNSTFVSPLGYAATWVKNLQAYSKKQLGFYFRAFGSAKSGYSNYWTGSYPSPMARPDPLVFFTGAISGTSATMTAVWPYATGTWTLTLPSGTIATATLTNSSAAVTFGSSQTEPTAATVSTSVYYRAYWDALCYAQPELVVIEDCVNNLYQCPNSTGANITPAADIQTMCNYFANNNASLKQIIIMECPSIELVPKLSSGGSLTNAQTVTVSALFRSQMRAAFYNTVATAGTRKVPIVYVPTYEQWAGDTTYGPRFLIGSNPSNIATSGSVQGPNGTSPNIHPCAEGEIRLADIMWPSIKSYLQNRQIGTL